LGTALDSTIDRVENNASYSVRSAEYFSRIAPYRSPLFRLQLCGGTQLIER